MNTGLKNCSSERRAVFEIVIEVLPVLRMTEPKKISEVIETSVALLLSAIVALLVFLLGWVVLMASGFCRA